MASNSDVLVLLGVFLIFAGVIMIVFGFVAPFAFPSPAACPTPPTPCTFNPAFSGPGAFLGSILVLMGVIVLFMSQSKSRSRGN